MSTMSEARFHDLVDALQQQVEDAFDDSDLDLDLENAGGVLTVRFENGSQLILSRQAPLRQLWVAAKSGGFHFDYDEASGLWRHDGSQEPLGALLNRATLEQGARMSSSPASEASPPAVASPCRRLCCLDDADVCVGCGRSLAEIREWGKADDSRRLQIRTQAARRQSLAGRLS